jgi:hypothetical protein
VPVSEVRTVLVCDFCSGSCVTSVAGPNGDAQLYER